MDGVIGDMVGALKAKNMWDNLLWFHQSDNGGPSFSGSSHTANNYPQKVPQRHLAHYQVYQQRAN